MTQSAKALIARDLLGQLDLEAEGRRLHGLAAELWPIVRSITGPGIRHTLARIGADLPGFAVRGVASGTEIFDWTVPDEWFLDEAWIEGPDGRRVVDVCDHSLHVLSYSTGVDRRMSREELDRHLHSLPDAPDLIPYRTSYYRRTWGFCLPHRLRESLPDGEYRVRIAARHEPGELVWGELELPASSAATSTAGNASTAGSATNVSGERYEDPGEILVSTHACHPSMANDNLSGLVVVARLAGLLARVRRRYRYRFLFVPGTVGAVAWLASNEQRAEAIRHGLVAANLGDGGAFHYKRSQRGVAEIDRAVARVLQDAGQPFAVEDFVPFGYDERQYCSPGFDLPVGSLTRTPWGRFPEYHTSADDLEFVRPQHLAQSLARYLEVMAVLEENRAFRNLSPKCEPQLGKRGLYGSLGGQHDGRERELALLWVLNQSDGERDLLAIAERSGLPFARLSRAADDLLAADLLAHA